MTARPPQSESELVDFIRAIDVAAPRALHERVEALVADAAPARRPARRVRFSVPGLRLPAWGLAAAGGVLAIALALALTLGGGSSGAPTLRGAVALSLQPATEAAPVQSTAHPVALTAAVGHVAFPYWEDRLGWRATGARHDAIDGSPSTTVFYSTRAGNTVAYTIVGGSAAHTILPKGGSLWHAAGTTYHLLTLDGVHVIAWERGGEACVIAGHDASSGTLVHLAATAA